MRLLYLPAYFDPEKYSGLYLNEDIIDAYLINDKNHEMIIYTPLPTRGITGNVRKEYKKRKREILYGGKLKIYRYSLLRENNKVLLRVLRYILQGIIQIIKAIGEKNIDAVMMSSTPPTNGIVGSIIKNIKKCPFIYNLQDIFPETLVTTKITKKESIFYKIGRKIEKITYKNADIIHVPSNDFKKNLLSKNVPEEKIKVVYNWVDEQKIKPIEKDDNTIFEELGLDRNKFYVVYAGNIGKAQNIELILKAAYLLKEKKEIQFVIFGEGSEKEKIINIIEEKELNNVEVFPLQPYEKVSNVYSMADTSIVICKKGFGQISIPSKTWTIMATGTPIIASFDKETELQKIIEENEIGIFTQAEDVEELKKAIITFYENRNTCDKFGKNARKYIEKNLSKKVCTQKYVESIKKFDKKIVEKKMEESIFKGKTLLITGGTGSFGHAVLNRFLDTDIGEIRIFSRDEKKQDDMRKEYHNDKIKFYIGDVRDLASVKNAMHGVDYIFHAAALKQVPSCEFFPLEAVKTNVIGTDNVLTAAIEEGVKKVICLSTDKAAYPVNAMGTSKAMMEKVIVAKSRTVNPEKTTICATRYGNVMCSRGSVIPLFIDQIKAGKPITVTEPKMTRFIMSLEEAVELVVFAFKNADAGDIMVQKAPACTIEVLAQAVKELFGAEKEETKIIGIRHGEKMYETLLTNEECAHAIDMGNFYRVPCDKRDLNYDKYFVQGNEERTKLSEFNSNNTDLLNVEQVKEKLLKLDYIQNELKDWNRGSTTVEANKLFGSN